MCTKARAYLTLLREYKAEIVMIVGFVPRHEDVH